MKNRYLISLLSVMTAVSCMQEIRHEGGTASENTIRFMTTEYEVSLTRSASEEASVDRMFLGMAGKDSLFLSTYVSDMPTRSAATRSEGSTEVPKSFHIGAFMDNAQEEYLNLKLTSSNNWSSYTPMLYWPYEYDKIHFFAWSYNLGSDHISPRFSTDNGFKAEFDYTIPYSSIDENDAAVQPDISFAITTEQQEGEDPVILNFVHALSSIEFKIGTIGDADVVSSAITLTDILSNGQCTITHPVSPESIEWTTSTPRETYTQTITEGVPFMIIPQELKDTEAAFDISIVIGDITHDFPPVYLKDLNERWEPNKKYTYIINKGGEVRVGVDRVKESNILQNIKIQNTGFTTSYIRAAVVGYWYAMDTLKLADNSIITVESIASAWEIDDTDIGTVSIPSTDWGWKDGGDGFYYHLTPVAPGEYTSTLFEDYTLVKTKGPVEGSRLKVNIAVQAIEATESGAAQWPEILQK